MHHSSLSQHCKNKFHALACTIDTHTQEDGVGCWQCPGLNIFVTCKLIGTKHIPGAHYAICPCCCCWCFATSAATSATRHDNNTSIQPASLSNHAQPKTHEAKKVRENQDSRTLIPRARDIFVETCLCSLHVKNRHRKHSHAHAQ